MNLIYFTNGAGLADGEIRRQCARIPEVLASLQDAQASHPTWDILNTFLLDEEFARADGDQRRDLVRWTQWGLFERFCRQRIVYAEIFYRVNYASPLLVAKEFRWLLRTGEPVKIYVIGPGLDEVPMLLRDARAEFIEAIDADPSLAWFWSGLKKVANA
ncbi:MAG: hypothetical protein KF802_15460 [Bdellovibrionaceae bacterium]|nr:hypothetical protein [Pseudobdellovibrionaceae bacterium]MBX3033484.1 hypothetical protein [Pseudobdellovibrionaceae bacterium]